MKGKNLTILIIALVIIVILFVVFTKKKSSPSTNSGGGNTGQNNQGGGNQTHGGGGYTGGGSGVINPFPLRVGSHGSEVMKLQQYLNSLGAALSVDGSFGNKTLQALQQYLSMSQVSESDYNNDVLGQGNFDTTSSTDTSSSGDSGTTTISDCTWYNPLSWGLC